jgi:protein gp37
MAKSKIEWTERTWNPVRGCTKISPGCKHCYAETFAERWRGIPGHPYEQGFDLRLVPHKLDEPLHWKTPARVFVNSMSDLFQEGVPFEYIDRVFAVMALCPQLTFQVLTKRPHRMLEYFKAERRSYIANAADALGCSQNDWYIKIVPIHTDRWPLPNVWLGVSAEDQTRANERIPQLLRTPATVRFVSYEPALEAIDFTAVKIACAWNAMHCACSAEDCGHPKLDWIIVGGESGPSARPFNINWARSAVRQCKESSVACFVKQLGAKPYACRESDNRKSDHASCIAEGLEDVSSGKGGDMSEWPEDLRVREFPRQEMLNA